MIARIVIFLLFIATPFASYCCMEYVPPIDELYAVNSHIFIGEVENVEIIEESESKWDTWEYKYEVEVRTNELIKGGEVLTFRFYDGCAGTSLRKGEKKLFFLKPGKDDELLMSHSRILTKIGLRVPKEMVDDVEALNKIRDYEIDHLYALNKYFGNDYRANPISMYSTYKKRESFNSKKFNDIKQFLRDEEGLVHLAIRVTKKGKVIDAKVIETTDVDLGNYFMEKIKSIKFNPPRYSQSKKKQDSWFPISIAYCDGKIYNDYSEYLFKQYYNESE